MFSIRCGCRVGGSKSKNRELMLLQVNMMAEVSKFGVAVGPLCGSITYYEKLGVG
ncbi:hypothetical protein [Algoriphagus boritolerans]|uniref:hypothetical protein n=1 Tax=Algoriphagus boritolerans TaxID=308111 RepID=UPI002FCE5D2A